MAAALRAAGCDAPSFREHLSDADLSITESYRSRGAVLWVMPKSACPKPQNLIQSAVVVETTLAEGRKILYSWSDAVDSSAVKGPPSVMDRPDPQVLLDALRAGSLGQGSDLATMSLRSS